MLPRGGKAATDSSVGKVLEPAVVTRGSDEVGIAAQRDTTKAILWHVGRRVAACCLYPRFADHGWLGGTPIGNGLAKEADLIAVLVVHSRRSVCKVGQRDHLAGVHVEKDVIIRSGSYGVRASGNTVDLDLHFGRTPAVAARIVQLQGVCTTGRVGGGVAEHLTRPSGVGYAGIGMELHCYATTRGRGPYRWQRSAATVSTQ